MTRGKLSTWAAAAAVVLAGRSDVRAQTPAATFKSSVDLVRIAAVVRDHKGRFVQDLSVHDFRVLEGGEARKITDFRHDQSGISVALLFDVSGSMESRLALAREAATHVISWLDPARAESAVYTFDTRLSEAAPFASGRTTLPSSLESIKPFGATSLHDAIARTAERVGAREGRRRAVVVFTDGSDNASHMSASDVSGLASSIDVPVYIFGIVPGIDNPAADNATSSAEHSALVGSLADLAAWTGGSVFIVSAPGQRSAAARQVVDELRHQYLLAFESSGTPGWHPLVVQARRDRDLVVRARSGYIAGQSRPSSD